MKGTNANSVSPAIQATDDVLKYLYVILTENDEGNKGYYTYSSFGPITDFRTVKFTYTEVDPLMGKEIEEEMDIQVEDTNLEADLQSEIENDFTETSPDAEADAADAGFDAGDSGSDGGGDGGD